MPFENGTLSLVFFLFLTLFPWFSEVLCCLKRHSARCSHDATWLDFQQPRPLLQETSEIRPFPDRGTWFFYSGLARSQICRVERKDDGIIAVMYHDVQMWAQISSWSVKYLINIVEILSYDDIEASSRNFLCWFLDPVSHPNTRQELYPDESLQIPWLGSLGLLAFKDPSFLRCFWSCFGGCLLVFLYVFFLYVFWVFGSIYWYFLKLGDICLFPGFRVSIFWGRPHGWGHQEDGGIKWDRVIEKNCFDGGIDAKEGRSFFSWCLILKKKTRSSCRKICWKMWWKICLCHPKNNDFGSPILKVILTVWDGIIVNCLRKSLKKRCHKSKFLAWAFHRYGIEWLR